MKKARWYYKGIRLTENLRTGIVSYTYNNNFCLFDSLELAVDDINSWRK